MTPLLQPFFITLRRRLFSQGRLSIRTVGLLVLGLGLLAALYATSFKVVGFFHRQNELGVILSLKIFQMAWVLLFAMLIFSSMVTVVSSLFLSRDNEIILAAPLPMSRIFVARFATSLVYTAWMMLAFSLPIFSAYAPHFKAGLIFLGLLLYVELTVAMLAHGIGLCTVIILVTLFPAKRTKDIVVYLSLLFSTLLFLVFRLLKPEDLANPDRFPDFMDYLSALQTPAAPLLPPSWASNLLTGYLQNQTIDWLLAGLLLLTPMIFYFFGELLMQRFFFQGYSKSQESFGGHRQFAPPPHSGSLFRWMLRKEVKTFLRDSAEWSQMFLVAALIVIYLYNFKVLPVDKAPIAAEQLSNLIAYANIALTSFLVASLSARFVFPSISAEGIGFGLIRCAPLTTGRYLLYKYVFYLIPFQILTLLLLVTTNSFLAIAGPMQWISLASGLVLTSVIVALALGFGAIHADFTIENRAALQGSYGTLIFLITALLFALISIALGSYPAYRLTKAWLNGTTIAPMERYGYVGLLMVILVGAAALVSWCLKKGVAALQHTV